MKKSKGWKKKKIMKMQENSLFIVFMSLMFNVIPELRTRCRQMVWDPCVFSGAAPVTPPGGTPITQDTLFNPLGCSQVLQ